jgi:hypothetical protein
MSVISAALALIVRFAARSSSCAMSSSFCEPIAKSSASSLRLFALRNQIACVTLAVRARARRERSAQVTCD